MSRIRQEISSVQFQIDARKANASMEALRTKAKDLNKDIETTKADIAALGNVAPDDANLLKYQKTLRELRRDLKDVERAERDLMKGVKAADQLWDAAAHGQIEQLSVKSIKAGQRGLQQRMQNLQPGDKADAQVLRAYKAVIEEADIVMKRFQADTNNLIATIKNGGSVSKTTLNQAKQDLQGLISLEKEGTKEWKNYTAQLNVVEGELKRLTIEQQRVVGQQTLGRAFRGDFATADVKTLEETIAKLREYQRVINDPNGSGARHYAAAETQIQKLQASLDLLKQKTAEASGQAMSFKQAMQVGIAAGGGNFKGSVKQLNLAKNTLEQLSQTATKDGLAWRRMQEQISNINLELSRTGHISKETQAILDSPKGKSFNELKAAIEQGRAALNNMRQTTDEEKKQFDQLAASIKEADIQMKQLGSSSKGTASQFEKAWSRLKTYVGLYVGAAVAMQKIVATMGDLMELSDKMGEVRKTTGFTADEVGRLSDNLKKLDVRTSLTSLMELSSLAGSVGLKTQQDVQGFTEAANQLLIALPEMGNESARTLIKIAQATGDLQKNNNDVRETLEKVGSTIIALRANSASAAGPITDFVSRVGAVGAQAGISIDQIAALGSTIDALGGRVEMSATALSRMIPAIRNNSYAIANSIGVTESYLKSLSAMDQMVLIFQKLRDSIKGINTETEEGQQQMADNIEAVLGKNAVMAEVMKDLNQQGARAGIVFGLLSQNVDELQKQLGIAGEAYQKNTALTEEFNKMNDTAAAKWERLKNQLEEMFVSDTGQRWLGDIIDLLRKLVDLISMDGPLGSAIRFLIVSATLFRVKWLEAIGEALMAFGNWILAQTQATAATTAETAATTANTAAKTANAAATTAVAAATEGAAVKTNIFTAAWGKMDKAMKANIIGLVAAAVIWLGTSLYNSARRAREAAKQIDVLAEAEKKAKEESVKERAELEKLYKVTQDQTNSMEERKKALRDMVGDEKYKQYYENLSTESELATAAASAYKELSEQILATARARALDAKAEELQRKRIELEDQKTEKQEWEDENRETYRKNKQAYEAQKNYVDEATRGMAGFPEAGIAQRGSAAMKPAIIDEFEGSIRERNRIDSEIAQIDKDIERLQKQVSSIKPQTTEGDAGGGGGGNKPYGDFNRVTSPYGDWDADSLVARRKEMLERVRSLANGADVQKVLSEDAKFISEAVRKNIKTTKDAIEWYNAERLKIQEALHEKHLTNTGDWMDPKKGSKKASKMVQDEMKYYLDELDAYYTERKAMIQQQRNDELISEGEAWRQTLQIEAEWQQRRGELQQLYGKRREKVAKEETAAILDILSERTDETTDYIKKDIENTVKFIEKVGSEKGKAAMDKIYGDIDLGTEKAFLRQRNTIGKQVQFMADTLAKERPFNGITENLQENLTKMGILVGQVPEKMHFLLGQIEDAYTLDVKEMVKRISEAGFKEWAEQISGDTQMQQALLAQLRQAYEAVQEGIRKEASRIKKDADMMWKLMLLPDGTNLKQAVDDALAKMTQRQESVSRANSLIGAGTASENVVTRLAIKQLQLQLSVQQAQYALMRKMGEEKAQYLDQLAEEYKLAGDLKKAERARIDAANVRKSINLAITEETKKQAELNRQIAKEQEEAQNRLYKALREWADVLSSGLQGVFEASNSGNEEYYNKRAVLEAEGSFLTKSKKTTSTTTSDKGTSTKTTVSTTTPLQDYYIIENAGTSDAKARKESLTELEYLEKQHEIEQHNARMEAWKKLMDDLNAKMNEQITDWINASLQNASVDANTAALSLNTEAIKAMTEQMSGKTAEGGTTTEASINPTEPSDWMLANEGVRELDPTAATQTKIDADNAYTDVAIANAGKRQKAEAESDNKIAGSAQSAFARMTQAANLYGAAYAAVSNENMSWSQKFGMIAVQAAGNAAITMLTTKMSETTSSTVADTPAVLSKLWKQLGWYAVPVFAVFTGLLGGLMGLATSAIAKGKSEIASATGTSASNSVASGRLVTGMLTYAEGNVNEFTNPDTLTPGRQYNVDAADGRTYRARYMGRNPKTHITNGPEFHLAGERGREAIIDAHTTRQIQMDDSGIWAAIKTLSAGGSIHGYRSRRSGMRAFAEGNISEFSEYSDNSGVSGGSGMSAEQILALQSSLDRNSEVLERAVTEGIKSVFNVYGKNGLIDSYDTGKKTVQRYGQRY